MASVLAHMLLGICHNYRKLSVKRAFQAALSAFQHHDLRNLGSNQIIFAAVQCHLVKEMIGYWC